MSRFFKFTWFPVLMAVLILAIYGGASLARAQKQNRVSESQIDKSKTSVKEQSPDLEPSVKTDDSQPRVSTAQPIQIRPTPDKLVPTPQASSAPKVTPKPESTSTSSPTPTPIPRQFVIVEIQRFQRFGSYQVELKENDTAFSVLLRAATKNNFVISFENYEGLGVFVNCIAGVCGHDNYYWAFYYNGQYSLVGASGQPVVTGDATTWKFEKF